MKNMLINYFFGKTHLVSTETIIMVVRLPNYQVPLSCLIMWFTLLLPINSSHNAHQERLLHQHYMYIYTLMSSLAKDLLSHDVRLILD